MIRGLQSSLRAKLLVAFLLVIAVGALTSIVVTNLVAPRFFEDHMSQMMGQERQWGNGMPSGGMQAGMDMLDRNLQAAFQTSVMQAVLVATAAATAVAVLAGLLISGRIVGRVRRIAAATLSARAPPPMSRKLAGSPPARCSRTIRRTSVSRS